MDYQLATLFRILTPQRKLSLLTRFWRGTAELVELTDLNLQQNN